LDEIRKSKLSYCQFIDEDGVNIYDYIVDVPRAPSRGKKIKIPHPLSEEYSAQLEARRSICLSEDTIVQAKADRAARLAYEGFKHNSTLDVSLRKPRKSFIVDPETIRTEDLVIRFHTYEHIPMLSESDAGANQVTDSDYREKVKFVPFLHYKYIMSNGNAVGLREVGRSHHKNGEFSSTHGSATPKLANMYILLCNKIAQKFNWRGYTYIDDMKGHALLQLSSTGLQFNEARSNNPFSYFTTTIENSFLRVMETEKKEQGIRDTLMENSGQAPSNTRQLEHEQSIIAERESHLTEK
jgi:hypothetical protein